MYFSRTFLLLVLLALVNSKYETDIAHNLVYMSDIAYEPIDSLNAWSCELCKTYPIFNVNGFSNTGGDLQGFTGYSKQLKAIVLSFRGSSNIANWITNLSYKLVAYSKCTNCKVHSGFLKAWGLAKEIVVADIQNLRALYRGAPIYVTGHSLGGALGALSVVDLQ